MSDSFTETTSVGWLSRIGGAIKGIVVGLIMVVVSFPVLFMNEGRAVHTRKDLEKGAKDFVSVDATTVESANEGKLVHLTGKAEATGKRSDPEFNVSAEGITLQRKVEMYQWSEKSSSKKKKKLGGSQDTSTTYSYEKGWSEGRLDSSKFKKPENHENPALPVASNSWTAESVSLGGFQLSESLVGKINQGQPLQIEKKGKLPKKFADRKVKVNGGNIYLAKEPSAPKLGDVRISYTVIPSAVVSVVSQQKGNSFVAHKGDSGTAINMLSMGEHTGEAMFESAQESNKVLTWILRAVGFVLMLIGFSLVFRPLAVVADVLPIAGSIVGAGTGIIAFLLAAPLSLITIAVAWIFYRPLIGIPLLLLAGVGLFFLFKKLSAQKKAA